MCYPTYSGYEGLDFCTGIRSPNTYMPHAIYLDLQKAFDRVPHARLISKFINGKFLQWI